MGKIRLLDESVVNRIAAGEVVERPASVVKELIENSLDAAARRVEVEVQGGGSRWIRVADDGEGMDRDDAVLALQRHATSKLAAVEDLTRIASLGFRGEALPSIAAVSELRLSTAVADGEGTQVEVRGGALVHVEPCARPRGTTVEVGRLFFNVPARRKFLRTTATELAHVVRWVSRYALARPDVAFRLRSEGGVLLDVAAVNETLERVRQVLGAGRVETLLRVEHETDDGRVWGFSAAPAHATARPVQHGFVNGRAVQDRLLWRAVRDAYENTLPAAQGAPFVLFLELDPREVDVNVHPQKTEVRFARPQTVYALVREALARALERPSAPRYGALRHRNAPAQEGPGRREPVIAEPSGSAATGGEGPPEGPAVLWGMRERGPWRALAQLRQSYIVAEDAGGLVLVDQHAAHERVLFERYLAAVQQGRVEIQTLLFPRTLELELESWVAIEAGREELARLGFRFEPFGRRTLRVDAVPAVAAHLDPEALLRELVDEVQHARAVAADSAALRRRLVTTAACRAAVTIRTPLGAEQMQQLLDDLATTDHPQTCPHGRPALFRLPLEEIERAFRRPVGRR